MAYFVVPGSAWKQDCPWLWAGVDGAHAAERIVTLEQADLMMMGRAHLATPHDPRQLAQELGINDPAWATLPAPYAHWLSRYRGPGKASAQSSGAVG